MVPPLMDSTCPTYAVGCARATTSAARRMACRAGVIEARRSLDEPLERRLHEDRAHLVEARRELRRELVDLGARAGISAATDGRQRRLDERHLPLRALPHAANVPRFDAVAVERDECAQERDCLLVVGVGRL